MGLRRMVTVRVPATTANMGPGFDCLGMALNVYNDLTVRTDVAEFSMTIEGEGRDSLPRHEDNLVMRGVKLAFKEAGIDKLPPLSLHLVNRIPIGAGLGSSSAAIVSGLLAGLALTDTRLPVEHEEKALQLAATIEGHVDNLAPCIYGGMQIGVHTGARWYTTGVNVPQGLQCILFIPEVRQETEACRAILPKEIPRRDAVFNIGRSALLVNAFASGNLDDLQLATQDALHQPVRSTIMPALAPCIAAALAAGAKGAFLSGAGSSIMALTSGRKGDIYGQADGERRDIAVARAMQKAAGGIGMVGKILITNPAGVGAHVTCLDDDPSLVVSGRALGVVPSDMRADDFHPSSSIGGRNGEGATSMGAGAGTVPAAASATTTTSSSSSSVARSAAAAPTTTPAPSLPASSSSSSSCSSSSAAPASSPSSSSSSTGGSGSIRYVSTRTGPEGGTISFTEAVFTGVAPDGGLYVPTSLPTVTKEEILSWWSSNATYADIAFAVLSKFVGSEEIPAADLRGLVDASYRPPSATPSPSDSAWDTPLIAPLVPLDVPALLHTPSSSTSSSRGSSGSVSGSSSSVSGRSRMWLLEQFHGPTCAFKDHALQLLGNLFSYLLTRTSELEGAAAATNAAATGHGESNGAGAGARMTILGATSGDTGSAAIAGLRGKPGVEVFILHPAGRVAAVQEAQMTSVLDRNVHNLAVAGATFDDCQTMVKAAFGDGTFRSRHALSAINSINWARVLAQAVYYFTGYVQALSATGPFASWTEPAKAALATALRSPGRLSTRNAAARLTLPHVTFVVPTGNFGNALSGFYARRMGLPISRLVVATNANDIMHRLISRGDYSLSAVTPTLAPSMDIQLASNLERYLYHVADDARGTGGSCGSAAASVRAWQGELAAHKRLVSFPAHLHARLQADFGSAAADDATINAVIGRYLNPGSGSSSSSAASPDAAPTADGTACTAERSGTGGGYALCPHTACGVVAAEAILHAAHTQRGEVAASEPAAASEPVAAGPVAVIVLATAHPAKFAAHTPSLRGLYGEVFSGAADPALAVLAATPTPAHIRPPLPPQLEGLARLPRQMVAVQCDVDEVKRVVDAMVGARA